MGILEQNILFSKVCMEGNPVLENLNYVLRTA